LQGLIQVEINICEMPDTNASVRRLVSFFTSLSTLPFTLLYFDLLCFAETRHWNVNARLTGINTFIFVVST